MAVYTAVDPDDLAALVGRYDIGTVLSCKGIAEGVENSNFLLETTGGRFILTLYERRVQEGDLPFFVDLLGHLRLVEAVDEGVGPGGEQLVGSTFTVLETCAGRGAVDRAWLVLP